MKHHFVQFDLAWLKNHRDHRVIFDFKNKIDPIHELADKAPGFIWRLITDSTNSTVSVASLGEDCVFNCTVWESREAMSDWINRNEHAHALERRLLWFNHPIEPDVVMWWIPSTHTPTLEEAIDRLQFLRTHGSNPLAFTLEDKFTPEDSDTYLQQLGHPKLGEARIGLSQARRCVDAYVAAWNEQDIESRLQMLTQVMTKDCIYADPAKYLQGRVAIVDYIHDVQDNYAGATIVRTSKVDVHHYNGRFNWCVIRGDGSSLPVSVDFVDFSRDGRIQRVAGFFGQLNAIDAHHQNT